MSENHSSFWVSEVHYFDESKNKVQISLQDEWLPYDNVEIKIDIFENRIKLVLYGTHPELIYFRVFVLTLLDTFK